LTLRLVDEKVLSLAQAIALVTRGPANILGLDSGHLGADATADICIFDPKATWSLTAGKMLSRGQNTPFLDVELRGRVTHTIIGGRLVYANGKFPMER